MHDCKVHFVFSKYGQYNWEIFLPGHMSKLPEQMLTSDFIFLEIAIKNAPFSD